MLKTISYVCVLSLAGVVCAAPALPTAIKPDDANLYYIGRFDLRDAAGPRCQWPASAVVLHFTGTSLQGEIGDSKGDDELAVSIDGGDATALKLAKGEDLFQLASGLPAGEHTVSVVKRTESYVGTVQFKAFYLNDGGKLLPPTKLPHKLEVIGDSISCGYGDEGADQNEHFKPATENAAMAYGAVAARALDAEYVCIAWSGKKMAPDNTLPALYDLALPMDSKSAWDFGKWQPDVVLINLSTNDWRKDPGPTEDVWVPAYTAFVERVRKNYPNATIYLATSPMMFGANKATVKSYLEKVIANRKTAGDDKVSLIEFPTQDGKKDGVGADWHPNLKTQAKDAAVLVDRVKQDLGWSGK